MSKTIREAAGIACTAALFMTGCQQVDAPADRAQPQELSSSGYQAEAFRLKQSGTTIGYDEALVALQRKYNLLPDQPPAGSGNAPSALNAAAKTAADKVVYSRSIALKGTYRRIIKVQSGTGTIYAKATATGTGDPMIALVRFLDDPIYRFQSTGSVNSSAQDSFQVATFDDDYNGALTASISYPKASADINRYYMLIVMPYSNQTTGTTTITYYQNGCANKPNGVCESSTETVPLVGDLYRSTVKPTSFTATSVNNSDPILMGFNVPEWAASGLNLYDAGCDCFRSTIGGLYDDDAPTAGRGSKLYFPLPDGHHIFMLTMKYQTEAENPAAATSVFSSANPFKVPSNP